jgi:hypothetical protein
LYFAADVLACSATLGHQNGDSFAVFDLFAYRLHFPLPLDRTLTDSKFRLSNGCYSNYLDGLIFEQQKRGINRFTLETAESLPETANDLTEIYHKQVLMPAPGETAQRRAVICPYHTLSVRIVAQAPSYCSAATRANDHMVRLKLCLPSTGHVPG